MDGQDYAVSKRESFLFVDLVSQMMVDSWKGSWNMWLRSKPVIIPYEAHVLCQER